MVTGATEVPLADDKLTTEVEIAARLESVRRQWNEAIYAPRRGGAEHHTTFERRNAKISKFYNRIEALSDRLHAMRRKAKETAKALA